MKAHTLLQSLAAAVLLAACASQQSPQPSGPATAIPLTPPADIPTAPVVRKPVTPLAPPPALAPMAPLPSTAKPPESFALQPFPAHVLYMCVTENAGQRQQTSIEFAGKVLDLCRKHPEMGPCQYEREVCRRAGGRVYAANGQEITLATEAEYDKKVMRVRFRAN